MSTFQSSDVLTNLSQLLPTGTFLAFQALAPLFTNNGDCGRTEKIVTGILLGFFMVVCFGLSFVDSVTTDEGKVYYGIVRSDGLYNPKFKTLELNDKRYGKDRHKGDSYFSGAVDNGQYERKWTDFINGALNVITFGALSCLTPPITTCYYPGISQTLVKTGPILAGLFAGLLFALFPSGRHGVGFATTTDKTVELVPTLTGSSTTGDSGHDDTPGANGDPEIGKEIGQKAMSTVE